MILRKPYAFFIKHFKLMHIILSVLVCYSLYNTKELLEFFNEYAKTIINVTGQNLYEILIPGLFHILPFLIIIFSIIILVVLAIKKKPNLFYIINIFIYIYTFIIIEVSNSTLHTMSLSLIDVRTARLVRDLILIAFSAQFFSFVFLIIRATGFDIKRFNFKQDLKDLEIDETDREEVEVEISFDKNRLSRKIRKKIRYLNYSYKENKALFNVAIAIFLIFIGILSYRTFFYKEPTLAENTYFTGNGLTMSVTNSYLVNTDYKGRIINPDYYYLILTLEVKSNNVITNIDTATVKVLIDNYIYTPTLENKDSFFDFGKVYQGENISHEYESKALVYKIPKELIDKEMVFAHTLKSSSNINFKTTKIVLKKQILNDLEQIQTVKLNEELKFTNSILKDYKIAINSFDVQKKYQLNYDFCVDEECFKSKEYLVPSISSNYDKALLKITGNIHFENSIPNIYDLYDFIDSFATLKYKINGNVEEQNIKFKEVISQKVGKTNTYYIEVLQEVINSDNISLIFTIRNKKYEYILK